MKGKLIFIFLLILLLSLSPVLAQENETDEICIEFFYGIGCPHCGRVDPYIDELEKNPNIHIHRNEIYENRTNLLVLLQYFENYDVPENQRGIPAVFVSDVYYVGDKPILENLPDKIEELEEALCVAGKINATGVSGDTSPLGTLSTIPLLTVIGAALVDSINPCAIAVLLILLAGLMAIGSKKRAIKAGLAFTLSIYIVYFLFGLGLFSALQITGLSFYFYKVIGFLAIFIGLANLKDFFWYGKGFVMEIPRTWRPMLKKLLRSVTSVWGAFLMGFLVCLFELPCTGGPYLFVLGLLAQKTTQMQAIPILLLYNLFFILPLIIIILAVKYGLTSVEKTDEWKERNIKKLHLVAGIVMLVLGVLVFSGLV